MRIPTTRKVRQKNKGKIVKDFQPAIFAMIFSALNDVLTYRSHYRVKIIGNVTIQKKTFEKKVCSRQAGSGQWTVAVIMALI